MSGQHYDFKLNQPPANTKPCVCGCPRGRHVRHQHREDGHKRSVYDGACQRPGCACAGYKAA